MIVALTSMGTDSGVLPYIVLFFCVFGWPDTDQDRDQADKSLIYLQAEVLKSVADPNYQPTPLSADALEGDSLIQANTMLGAISGMSAADRKQQLKEIIELLKDRK